MLVYELVSFEFAFHLLYPFYISFDKGHSELPTNGVIGEPVAFEKIVGETNAVIVETRKKVVGGFHFCEIMSIPGILAIEAVAVAVVLYLTNAFR